MGTRIKICGNASAADAQLVAALAPDFMGYIFWPGSKRCVKAEDVRAWAKNLPPIPRVGVFVNATPDAVKRAVETAGLTVIQCHGGEDPALVRNIAPQLWQVIKLPPAQLPETGGERRGNFQTLEISAGVDAVLLDTNVANAPGGTGITGDWDAARTLVTTSSKPVLLAGGLTPENVRAAIQQVKPWGVDVSSGVESAPGKKDRAKVAAFIAHARGL